MSNYVTRATELFLQGYNCCQSVAGAFAAEMGMELDTVLRLSSSFGGGFARTRSLCGTISAMGMVLGVCFGGVEPNDRGAQYKLVRELTDRFTEKYGTLVCGELLKNVPNLTSDPMPDGRTPEYYKARPCLRFVQEAALLTEERLRQGGKL